MKTILKAQTTVNRQPASKTPTDWCATVLMSSALLASIHSPSAQAGVYSFGGSCPSQGAWTQMALQQTQAISDVVRQLKDDPNCKGIGKVITDLQAANTLLQTPKDEIIRENRLESLPTEIDALRADLSNTGRSDPASSTLLMTRTLQAAQINSSLNQNSTRNVNQWDLPNLKNMATNLFTRYAAPTQKGIDLVNNIFQALPAYDECLIGRPRQGLAILSGAVKVAAAFSAAGEGVGSRLGDAISNLGTLLRDRRFSLALRKLNETEFWFSVSCLMESTAKNYCDAESAQEVLQYSKDRYLESAKRNLKDRKEADYDNPLEGYYLLVRELPMISAWLQQVQFGVTPKLNADANFKNKIWEQVTDLTQSVNTLNGMFNEQMLFLRELPDSSSKRNQLFDIIAGLVERMTTGEATSAVQFYTTTVNPDLLPFYLIGMDNIPAECRASKNGGFVQDWRTYMRKGGDDGNYIAQFKDPDALALTIQNRMNTVIAGAAAKSSAYFRQRLIVDMPNLVDKTLTGQYMTVRKSFENVYNYLVRFEKKLSTDNMDLTMIPGVRETRTKILKFLKSYDKLRDLGAKMVQNPKQTDAMLKEVSTSAQVVIDTVFNEFNILFQKDTFLTNRLTTYIDKDFSMRIRSGLNMTEYQNDLLVITQKHLMEKLTEVHQLNPTSASIDLAKAQVVNRRNIEAMEEIFKDSLFKMILQVKAVANGGGEAAIRAQLDKKYQQEIKAKNDAAWFMAQYSPMGFGLGGLVYNWFTSGMHTKSEHPDLFDEPNNPRKVTGIDDKFGSFAQFQAQLCAQTLAFEDRGYFFELCNGSVMKSYYSGKTEKSKLDLRYNDYMKSAAAGSTIRKSPTLISNNICALHHFSTRNMVKWMKDQDAEVYQEDGSF
jgi:hypothetical protein